MSDVSLDLVRREITSRSRGDSRDGLDDDIARDFPFLDHARPSTRFTLAYLLFPEKNRRETRRREPRSRGERVRMALCKRAETRRLRTRGARSREMTVTSRAESSKGVLFGAEKKGKVEWSGEIPRAERYGAVSRVLDTNTVHSRAMQDRCCCPFP